MAASFKRRWLTVSTLLFSCHTWAHSGGEAVSGGFLPGAAHPFSGLDHLLAMLAVGLWAAQNGGRWLWALPLTFVTLMQAGALGAMAGWNFPYAEQAILGSLLFFGLMVASACPAGKIGGGLLVAVFAVFHGYAHTVEMPATLNSFSYSLGFLLSTALLHCVGIGAATLVKQQLTRLMGVGIAFSGVCLAVV